MLQSLLHCKICHCQVQDGSGDEDREEDVEGHLQEECWGRGIVNSNPVALSSLWPLGSFSLSPIYGMYAISRFLEVRAQYRACNVEEGEVVISKSWRRSRWWWWPWTPSRCPPPPSRSTRWGGNRGTWSGLARLLPSLPGSSCGLKVKIVQQKN